MKDNFEKQYRCFMASLKIIFSVTEIKEPPFWSCFTNSTGMDICRTPRKKTLKSW